MTSGKGTNPEASIHGRLLHIARQRGEKFEPLLIRFALERLLYRLSQSSDGQNFVLKGALLFVLWDEESHRPTRDIDLASLREPSIENIEAIFRRLCDQPTEEDRLVFHSSSIKVAPIREEQRYGGIRVQLRAGLGKANIPVRVDVGFGDAITPGPEVREFPTLLSFPKPRMKTYPPETVVAEKFQAIVDLGLANSRMKDFFDLLYLLESREFDGHELSRAIAATFRRRQTALPQEIPTGLSHAFAADSYKMAQWDAFLRKIGVDRSRSLIEVVERLVTFLLPPTNAARDGIAFDRHWKPGGPWRP